MKSIPDFNHNYAMKLLTTFSRIFVGVLFILSGLIKANDPVGFSIKLDEYFTVFHMEWLSAVSLFLAIFICVIEIVLGIALLLGYKIKPTAWLLLLMILFFTWLTGYSAVTGKVTDCGCFGDAIKLTPIQSFYKDLILLFFIGIIFFRRNHIRPLLGERSGNAVMIAGTLLSTGFSLWCYYHLPVIDFRPYAIGKNILKGMEIPEGAPRDEFKTYLYYEKNGEVKEFTTENYPWNDSTWVWKDTKNVRVKKGYEPPIHDFVIRDYEGGDHTQEILSAPGYTFFVVCHDVNKANRKAMDKVNGIAAGALKTGVPIIGLSGSTMQTTDEFRHEHNTMFDFYLVDATPLKTMIRSNPGLMLIKDGTVVDMWHYNDIPSFGEISSKHRLTEKTQ
jgi:uncharacterized membrane protein YphA (DoxX/SURF4 family)